MTTAPPPDPTSTPVTLRRSRGSDNPRLCELFASVRMEADLCLAVERDPDFFALYDLQGGERSVWVGDVDGRVECVVAGVGRRAWLDGEQVVLGYLGDARVSVPHQGKGLMRHAAPRLLENLFEDLRCDVALAAVVAGNRAALGTAQTPGLLASSVEYRPVYALRIVSVQFNWRRKPRPTSLEVRPARADEVPEVAAFLAADQARRPFGYVIDEAALRERLARWPGLSVDSFYLARDAEGRLRGVLAWWDAGAVKRYRVHGYFRGMRVGKALYNAAAWVARFQPLPPVGELLRYFYVTHLAVPDDDPAVFGALIDRLYADLHGRGYNFFTLALVENDPLEPALKRFQKTYLGVHVYLGYPKGSRFAQWQPVAARPGFEIALA